MVQLAVPDEYLVEGLEAVGYDKPNDKCEAVYYKTPNGKELMIAKDMMGIQICAYGRLWPDKRSWQSMEEGIKYLRENVSDTIAFFESPSGAQAGKFEIGDVLFAAAMVSVNSGGE